jgi:hypothetical protein
VTHYKRKKKRIQQSRLHIDDEGETKISNFGVFVPTSNKLKNMYDRIFINFIL